MIDAKLMAGRAEEYLQVVTCYLKGFWGQRLTYNNYNRILKMYPENAGYHNTGLIMTDAYPFDCICFVKQLLGGGSVEKRLTYEEMKDQPLGDCDNIKFLQSLYDCCSPEAAGPGYGLATRNHAALCLGDGKWIDVNYTGRQNGAKLHEGFNGYGFICGKIPGVSYEEKPAELNKFEVRTVKEDYTGNDVLLLQRLLAADHWTDENGNNLILDGEFGPHTAHALRNFQKFHDLQADAIAGPLTWQAILDLKVVKT